MKNCSNHLSSVLCWPCTRHSKNVSEHLIIVMHSVRCSHLSILILKIMLRHECYYATLVDEETTAQRDLKIYLWPYRWRISESEYKSRNVQLQKPSMFTIILASWCYKKIKSPSLSEVNLCVQMSQSREISLF